MECINIKKTREIVFLLPENNISRLWQAIPFKSVLSLRLGIEITAAYREVDRYEQEIATTERE